MVMHVLDMVSPKWRAHGLKWYEHGRAPPCRVVVHLCGGERVRAIGGGAVARHKLWEPLWTAVSGIIIPLGVWEAAELMGGTSSVIG